MRRELVPECQDWQTVVEDPVMGPVRLTGRLRHTPHADRGSETLLLIVHGLGACADASYTRRAARLADAAGFSSLRLNLRGADRLGDDYYHAGLTEDIRSALASPEAERYRKVAILGFSLGGHTALRYATEAIDPRLRAVAAVCSPLDLAAGGRLIDRPGLWAYRRYLFNHLMEIYDAVAERRPVPLPPEEARRIRFFRDWDTRIVAARHGFRDADDYYSKMSVGPRLPELGVPALLVAAEDDPMVPAGAIRPVLERHAGNGLPLEAHWVPSGGHMAFSPRLDLGLGPAPGEAPGVEAQVLSWLRANL
jgi:predicted alpha/beta-fold hydrolase